MRSTFTTSDGTRKDRRIPQELPAQQAQLREAEARVLQLASIIKHLGLAPELGLGTVPMQADVAAQSRAR